MVWVLQGKSSLRTGNHDRKTRWAWRCARCGARAALQLSMPACGDARIAPQAVHKSKAPSTAGPGASLAVV
eukprot:scaffold29103_cov76-Phaeocystis_antarctica.AAC.1